MALLGNLDALKRHVLRDEFDHMECHPPSRDRQGALCSPEVVYEVQHPVA